MEYQIDRHSHSTAILCKEKLHKTLIVENLSRGSFSRGFLRIIAYTRTYRRIHPYVQARVIVHAHMCARIPVPISRAHVCAHPCTRPNCLLLIFHIRNSLNYIYTNNNKQQTLPGGRLPNRSRPKRGWQAGVGPPAWLCLGGCCSERRG